MTEEISQITNYIPNDWAIRIYSELQFRTYNITLKANMATQIIPYNGISLRTDEI